MDGVDAECVKPDTQQSQMECLAHCLLVLFIVLLQPAHDHSVISLAHLIRSTPVDAAAAVSRQMGRFEKERASAAIYLIVHAQCAQIISNARCTYVVRFNYKKKRKK